ncbi:MAG: 7-cyano-7-deazaguanine synthase [Candidatus Thermoplasmatota archaeon]|nr:7-cyano-7-deazaguanine synthase [Candidatus Thermoplasmatota archaeon]
MQGIAGTYGSPDRQLARRMLERISHRGPDRKDLLEDDRLVITARRARPSRKGTARAIVEDDGVAVASDCYLFNSELLKELFLEDSDEDAGDADLLISMYEAIGTKMFGYLDGAFAIAISDNGRLVLARDRYGLKPIYISGGSREGTFSSEIKSQMVAGDEFVPFPPGKVLVAGKGFSPIWPRRSPVRRTRAEPKSNALRELVLRSVRSCSREGQGLNVLLSGGIDSSVIAAAATEAADEVQTVCVGTEQSEDLRMARKVAERIGSSHKERVYGIDGMLDVLEDVVYAAESFDYPLIRSCIPNYMATHLFSDIRLVTLCGEGGDEIFAGYDYMRTIKGDDDLRRERRKLLRTGWMTGFQRVDRMTASASLDGRMPLMSRDVIEFGLSLKPPELVGPGPERNKLLLRKAFEDSLPAAVAWRRKQRFSDGAGSIQSLVSVADEMISDAEFEKERGALPRGRIRTKEELLYYRHFIEKFPSESAVAAVGFSPRA